jgi:hypothetical protein
MEFVGFDEPLLGPHGLEHRLLTSALFQLVIGANVRMLP